MIHLEGFNLFKNKENEIINLLIQWVVANRDNIKFDIMGDPQQPFTHEDDWDNDEDEEIDDYKITFKLPNSSSPGSFHEVIIKNSGNSMICVYLDGRQIKGKSKLLWELLNVVVYEESAKVMSKLPKELYDKNVKEIENSLKNLLGK